MSFLALFIIGGITYFTLPVSLLPDIEIPEITIQVNASNISARELDNTVVTPIRRQLLQLSGLNDIQSTTSDGNGIIRIKFDFGVNIDLAFIEVNEKIDMAMNSLPDNIDRPKVIKASATDIPVLYVNMTLKNDIEDEKEFLSMCDIVDNTIKRRIEQLPEVAMADVTGIPDRMIQITPNKSKLEVLGITLSDIESIIKNSNAEYGSMSIRDGYLQYKVNVENKIQSVEDINSLTIKKSNKLFQISELCDVKIVTQKLNNYSLFNGKRAITMAIIKHSTDNMDNMKSSLTKTIDFFKGQYPDINFSINRSQTELLDYTISNLQQNLILGLIFIFIVSIAFLGDVNSPVVIGVSMLFSVVITFLCFYLFNISLNIISLAGLIMAVGMMIDSSIIVTENIEQIHKQGASLLDACDIGTTQVITPMLSSSLTTIAVFFPLIFMSGIAGALFYDQAFSLTSGLAVSYLVGIMLLPVLFSITYKIFRNSKINFKLHINNSWIESFYNKGFNFTFKHWKTCIVLSLLTIPLCIVLFIYIKHDKLPEITQNEIIGTIDWNENIHIDESKQRTDSIIAKLKDLCIENSAYVGPQDFLLDDGNNLSSSMVEMYFKAESEKNVDLIHDRLLSMVHDRYPNANVAFSPPETLFEKVFSTADAEIVAKIYPKNLIAEPKSEDINEICKKISTASNVRVDKIPFRNQLNIKIDNHKLLLYNVSYDEVYYAIKNAFSDYDFTTTLHTSQRSLPVLLSDKRKSVEEVLSGIFVGKGDIPLGEFVSITETYNLKTITSGAAGEYIPLKFYNVENGEKLVDEIRETISKDGNWSVDFSGDYFSGEQLLTELCIILVISLLLMYFIMCSQFESFIQPLIVILEIPIDTCFALICLHIFGYSLNLMSAIGIIVSCGIVVNDSILKLDRINTLFKEGMGLKEAIHVAGTQRVRAIIMTSLTTIFALVPIMFTNDLGSQLQKPLTVAMIGSMIIGTLVSLFIIPIFYWLIYRNKTNEEI